MAAVVLSACTAGATEAPDLAAVSADKVADEVFQADDIDLIESVRNGLIADCMAGQGYPQLKQAGVPQDAKPFTDMNVQTPPFAIRTDEQATLLGFGENSRPKVANVLSYDRGFDARLKKCQNKAEDKLGHEFSEVQNQSYQLYNDVADERDVLLKSPEEAEVTAAALRPLLECVEAAGFRQMVSGARTLDSFGIGLPRGRYEGTEPPEPKRLPGTVEIIPAIPERRYVPTAEESRLAVASARCARTTGFGDKIAAQRVRILRKVVGGHGSQIAELKPKVEALAKAAAKLAER
ncbi:hypothetical protein [Streptomyces torulosus]|uniref:hypothetical protein n=1 Tax=Streptomyces torulosus TaxID=68276 RepID=UPI0006EB2D78|nr:hypothetical protein [Streptomyces torulosus]